MHWWEPIQRILPPKPGTLRGNAGVLYTRPHQGNIAGGRGSGDNTFFGRTDDHITGILKEHWNNGGTIQWFAQICPDRDDQGSWRKWITAAAELGASGAYLHGGIVDYWHANGMEGHFKEALQRMRDAGIAAVGFAGHKPEAHAWMRDHLEVDFQMCSHYNPTDQSQHAQHIDTGEKLHDDDRARMLEIIATIEKPVVHYKVFAGGNKPIIPAFELLGRVMRKNDIVCVGMFPKDDPQMIAQNAAFVDEYVEKAAQKDSVSRMTQ
ncbi:MAG: hypothetical protein AUJ92_03795 [Armatimonadetes bacterium CG2_30_59_28]|nr:hypothetical protein [Armatimonadota bacterium]OIO97424.1 MAG: hypothetical protein AUJ92_03795 [Armatimonadetes bacterium CG2_30_59_28]PIU66059.1 MAG: hypothetical protein COS85_06345 [Armatimonadetes bacterium CG07_land_8_20_14_0_80_59_28]PIX38444.1 MAG: hypothetical protein COZ56_20445 [Armatimonadetes bacterium CG_4_8_14_3_um_filter_58_9]PIY38638.1 MAG: hypothetical protein COZ05_20460 [Armatimonadetes bacterium CG_4_10_14_3_um_filter_59_10]